ncbi:MAG TPA: amidase [Opitutaceae bacterium]|nr:amidase [Opitutaceae bacterium]
MPLTRRRFIARCAVGTAASQLPAGLASAAGANDSLPTPAPMPSPPEGITADTLAAGEKLAGIQFTPAQRQPLIKNVAERAKSYAELRTPVLPNQVFPALTFDLRMSGVQVPAGAVERFGPAWSPGKVERTAGPDELAFMPVAHLAALLRSRAITSRQLTELSLARLKKFDPVLAAVVTLTEERALRQADAADAELKAGRWRGPLHGVPWGAKDLLAVRGYPTTWGAATHKEQRFDEDAEVVRRLDAAGAVLVAKLTLGALANNDGWFGGQTKCPWNLALGSSGSSAGPCAAVAAGLVPFAIGSETLGSIVSPCTRNGVTGLRPTYGRVSRAGAMTLAWSMDKLGPIARTVEDCALIFDAIHGADPADPTAVDAPFVWRPPAKLGGQRIGYLASSFEQAGEWLATNQAALATVKQLGAELVPIELPSAPTQTMRLILNVEAAAAFDDLILTGGIDDLLAPRKSNWADRMREARYITAVEYIQANRIRTLMVRDLEKVMADARVDVLVTPPGGAQLVMTNLTGHPTACVPSGFIPVKDQPADSPRRNAGSLSFIARLYRDDHALAAAQAFQQATDFHTRRPPIA